MMNLNDPILEGSEWVWPDGTRLPLVRGGSDLSDVGAPVEPEAPAAPAPDTAAPPDAPSDAGGEPPAADPPVERYAGWPDEAVKAHEKLLDENVKYRQRWKPYEDTFGSLHEQDQEFFLGFIDALRTGEGTEVARYAPAVRDILDKMSPAEQKAAVKQLEAAAAEGEGEEFDPFDKSQVEKLAEAKARAMFEERDKVEEQRRADAEQKAAVERATGEIQAAAKAAADEHGIPEWGDPTSGLYAALVSVAHRSFPGETTLEARIAKAAEHLRADFDRRGQELLKAKSAGAGDQPAPPGGEQPSGRKVPTNLDEATESALRRLEGIQRGGL